MKIDKTFKIKEKYFNAILKNEKRIELRDEYVKPKSIIKLNCIENGKSIIFKSGNCIDTTNYLDIYQSDSWFDDFCIEYCKKHKKIYSIRIDEIIEVK